MPFMRGAAPIRNTAQYLEKGKLFFKDKVKIVTIQFNTNHTPSKGAQDFVFWHFAQMQYKNPDVQICVLNNMTPSPYVQCFFDNGQNLVLDIDGLEKNTILDQVKRIFCKTDETLAEEELARQMKENPGNFGYRCNHHCICEIPGQVPCPRHVVLPKNMRGRFYDAELPEPFKKIRKH